MATDPTSAIRAQALDLLHRLTRNPTVEFREHQREAVSALVADHRRVLCVQRTGWGKSAVYFIATALLRRAGNGPTLLISPLIALMRNQIMAAETMGLTARTINSSNFQGWADTYKELAADQVDLLLISPERLNNPRFRAEVLPTFLERVGLMVVDEAHCISDWGHDFRPDYRRISVLVDELSPDVAVLCTTATANDRVVADIEQQLSSEGEELLTFRGSLDRAALRLEVVELPSAAERLAWLATHLPALPGSGIVYCLTVRDTAMVAEWLRGQGIPVEAYSGESDANLRPEIEKKLLANDVKAVVATSALGMGYDKPDLGFVIHFQAPGSPIAYYQQVGRAGRQLSEAHGILLRGSEDRDIQDYFIDVAFPSREDVEAVLGLLAETEGLLRLAAIEALVNVRHARLAMMLKVLELEGAVERVPGRGWIATGVEWEYDAERVRRVTETRRAEQRLMEDYASGASCLLQTLRQALDDPAATPCGRCAVCTQPKFTSFGSPELAQRALEHIRSRPITLEPRRRWAGRRGGATIPQNLRAEFGRALSEYNDPGWGHLVAEGKWKEGCFGDALLIAAARLIDGWDMDPAPTWLTTIPSLNRPNLVPAFGERLAERIGLHFEPLVKKVRETPAQKQMQNSHQQADNVHDAFALTAECLSAEPVVLVDDIRDSGWTMTFVAALLRENGAGPVYPFALALAGGKG